MARKQEKRNPMPTQPQSQSQNQNQSQPQIVQTPVSSSSGIGIGPSAEVPVEGLDSLFSKKGARKTGRRDSTQLVAPPIPPQPRQPSQTRKNKTAHGAQIGIGGLTDALDKLTIQEKTKEPIKDMSVSANYIPVSQLQQQGATLAKEKAKFNLKNDKYVRRFEDTVHYDTYHMTNRSLQQGEKTITLSGADFTADGNCFFTVPLEAERIKVREINMTNLMPTINVNSNYTIRFEEESFTGKVSSGTILETAPLAQGIYDLVSMKAAIENAMFNASLLQYGITYANNYVVTFSRLSGTTSIACYNQGVSRNFRLYFTPFVRDVLGYDSSTDLLEGGATYYHSITGSNVFSFVYGGTISIESNLTSYTNTVGKNRTPTMGVIPLSSPQFFALNIRPDFPAVELGEKKAISHIKLTFRNTSDQSILNKYIFQSAALFYIVFSYE